MPVSPLSSEHSAPHRSRSIPPWNSTDNRADVDPAGRDMRNTPELDGTGLHDRPDWPLRSSPEPEGDWLPEADTEQHQRREAEQERANKAAMLKKQGEAGQAQDGNFHFEEHDDVSDLEDEGEDSISVLGDRTGPPYPTQLPHPDLHDRTSSIHRESHRTLSSPPRGTHFDVSPVREEYAPTPSPSQDFLNHAGPSHIQQQYEEVPSIRLEVSDYEESQEDEVERAEREGERRQEGEDHDEMDTDGCGADEAEELRDIATAIPFGSDPMGSQHFQQQRTSTYSSLPLVNGHSSLPQLMTANSNTRASIAKGPMHSLPQRRSSIRNRTSWISTSRSKNHVRYSWQSIQDDEPNRPRIHIIKLVSNTATASAGFPTGEAFGFSISPAGRKIAAFNSARLYVLQTNALPVDISQDYALKRRPLAVELTDECNTMAILADDHTVNIYDTGLHLKRVRTIKLDFPTTCITLAPSGGLLAAAYEGGVEVFSLAPSALPTDRRAVRSMKMDRLSFSEDGSTLLGTTTRINIASTVVVNVPIFPAAPSGIPTHEELKEAWCSELLQPENIRNSSHAIFLREARSMCNERLFAWNGLEDTFGILNVGDMQYGHIDFPVVISPPLSTCGGLGAAIHSCPAIDEHGDTVAMIVNDRTIRLYLVPHDVEEAASASVEAHSIDHELDEGYGCPFSEARWVHSPASLPAPLNDQAQVQGRLIVTSPGGVVESGIGEESVEDIEGGRVIVFDFDPQFAGQPGQTFSLALGKSPPQMLEEEEADLAEEVALVRRRTVNQSKGKGLSSRPAALGRAATTTGPRPFNTTSPTINTHLGPPRQRSSMISLGSMQSEASRSLPELMESAETADAFEEPYVQGAPRSQASLQRAASNVQRHRFQTLEERQREWISIDSHGDFLALPEYTEEPNAPLPSRYRQMAGLDKPTLFTSSKPAVIVNANGGVAGRSSSGSTPQTAPPDIGEHFSADVAFRTANERIEAAREDLTFRDLLPERQPPPTSTRDHVQGNLPLRDHPSARDPPSRQSTVERSGDSSITHTPVTTPTSIPRADPLTYFQPPNRGASRESFTPARESGTFDSGSSAYGSSGSRTARPPVQSPGPNGTFDSLARLPRGLQRAYSNAISPVGPGYPPGLQGEWRNVSPISNPTPHSSYTGSSRGGAPLPSSSAQAQAEEAWDVISPVTPIRQFSPLPPSPNLFRRSSPMLSTPAPASFPQAPGTASSYATTLNDTSTPPASSAGESRMPAHVQAFRSAAAAANASASASLFPTSQPRDHVPLRENTIKAGSVAHPITAWHPPAAASTPNLRQSRGSIRGGRHHHQHVRKNSAVTRSAYSGTSKAKKRALFKKSVAVHDPYGLSSSSARGRNGEQTEDGSMLETKSMMTWITKRPSRCIVM